jgi:hypothetical protein
VSSYDVSDPQTESGKQHPRVPRVRQNGAEIHTSWECVAGSSVEPRVAAGTRSRVYCA